MSSHPITAYGRHWFACRRAAGPGVALRTSAEDQRNLYAPDISSGHCGDALSRARHLLWVIEVIEVTSGELQAQRLDAALNPLAKLTVSFGT
jgi:hypothetical protein